MKEYDYVEEDKRINKSFENEGYLRGFCRYTKRKLFKHIQFHQHHNAYYDRTDILDLLTKAALDNVCLESASKTIKDALKRPKPSADSVLRYIAKFEESEILEMFQRTSGYLFKVAKSKKVFKREVDIAIDYHDQHYYGDKNDVHVVEGKTDRGTIHYFRYITLSIVEKGRRFTVKALPVNKLSLKERQVEELLRYAQRKFKLKIVYLDRGFFSNKMVKLLSHLGLRYVIRARLTSKIARLSNRKKNLPIVERYFLAEKSYTRLVVTELKKRESEPRSKGRVYYITNLPVNEKDAGIIDSLYKKRWGIETSYRVKKHGLRIKTTSQNPVIRLFLFMFSVALYNSYYLANIIIGEAGRINWIIPFIPAKIFISSLLHVYTPPHRYCGGYG